MTLPLGHETTHAVTKDSNIHYTVYNPDTEWALCNCEWAQHRNQVKTLIMKGVVEHRAVQTYNTQVGTQQGGLNCQVRT
ncbi:unnamed protein product [Calypogeia fissa]